MNLREEAQRQQKAALEAQRPANGQTQQQSAKGALCEWAIDSNS